MTKPIAWMCEMPPKDASYSIRMTTLPEVAKDWPNAVPLVKQREWVGLTEKERMEILRDYNENPDQYSYGDPMICFGQAFEDKLKEKNT